jgi:hypothetical protein
MPASHDDPFPQPEIGLAPSALTTAGGNGHGPGDGQGGAAGPVDGRPGDGRIDRRRRGPGPTVWPATIVIGVALVVLISGAVAAVFSGGPVSTDSAAPVVKTAPGAPVTAVTARDALAPIITPGRPPADVVDAVVLPAGAAVAPGSAGNHGVGLYDRSIGFTSSLSEAAVIAFYQAELPVEGWKVISQGPPHGAPGFEVLAKMSGSDGYVWELGATVAPTVFPGVGSSTPSTPSTPAAGTGTTPFTLRLFAVSDAA